MFRLDLTQFSSSKISRCCATLLNPEQIPVPKTWQGRCDIHALWHHPKRVPRSPYPFPYAQTTHLGLGKSSKTVKNWLGFLLEESFYRDIETCACDAN
jgi:hypothetical protein